MKLETLAKRKRAKIPTQGSDAYNILLDLVAGKKISMLVGPSRYSTVAVSQRISDLRIKFGWDVQGEFRKTKTGRRFMEYSL